VIAAKDQSWDFDSLSESLHGLKEKTPAIRSAILIADNAVAYRDVMATMEKARGEIPSVNLGGF
jgi:biopolymer transport protein ExbD